MIDKERLKAIKSFVVKLVEDKQPFQLNNQDLMFLLDCIEQLKTENEILEVDLMSARYNR